MIEPVFPCAPLPEAARAKLLAAIGEQRQLWAPCQGEDGSWRLQPVSALPVPGSVATTFLPLKKMLLPCSEELWTSHGTDYRAPASLAPFAVVGVPLCDLQAVWYLDQVFADDLPYMTRRVRVLLVGLPCEPGPECRCDGQLMPPAGDLFVDRQRAWALSPAGEALLQAAGCRGAETLPLPWPAPPRIPRPMLCEESLQHSAKTSFWTAEAQRCLSCGACSAVCPTCYCFDVRDDAALDGSVTRRRVWDNCFFAEHGKVAGGHDFRPDRAARLRFRLQHKFFGFGALHGQNSCVGCGRCRKACPVGIDLDQTAVRLAAEAAT